MSHVGWVKTFCFHHGINVKTMMITLGNKWNLVDIFDSMTMPPLVMRLYVEAVSRISQIKHYGRQHNGFEPDMASVLCKYDSEKCLVGQIKDYVRDNQTSNSDISCKV